jgi:hypothetical protein
MSKPTTMCRACKHEKRDEIDRLLIGGDAPRRVAARYKGLSTTGLQRHQKHIGQLLKRAYAADPDGLLKKTRDAEEEAIKEREAQEKAEATQASSVLAFVRGLVAKAHQFTDAAEQKGDLRTAMSGLRELTRMAELLAKLTGELDQRSETNVLNVHVTPEAAAKIAETYLLRRRVPPALPEVIDVTVDQ